MVDEIKAALSGMLAPEKKESFLAWSRYAGIHVSKVGTIAGCYVLEGMNYHVITQQRVP